MAFRAQARIGQDLCDGVFGRRRLLALVGARQRADVVGGVVIRDELQRVGDALSELSLPNRGHNEPRALQGVGLVILSRARAACVQETKPTRRFTEEPLWQKRSRAVRRATHTTKTFRKPR